MILSIRTIARPLSRCLILLALLAFTRLTPAQNGYDALLTSARASLQSGQNEQAVTTANKAIAADKARWEAYAVAGGALMNLKRYEEAADQLSQAIQHAPESKQPGLRDLRKQCLLAESGVAPAATPAAAPTAPTTATTQAEVILWKSIEKSTNPDDFSTYLTKYPNGAFAPLAQRQLAEFDKIAEQQMAQQAANSNSPADTQRYLDHYPAGEHAAVLRARLPTLDRRSEVAKVGVLLNKHPQLSASLAPDGACAILVKQETLDASDLHSAKNPLIWIPGVQMAVVFAPGAHQVKFDSYTLDFSKLTPDQIAVKHERVPKQKKELYTNTIQIDLPAAHSILVQLGVGSTHTKDDAKVIMNLTPDSCQIPGEKVDKCTTNAVNPYHLSIPFANEQDAQLYADNLQLATRTCAGFAAQSVVPIAAPAPSLYSAHP